MTVADQDSDPDRLAALRNRLASEIDMADSPQDLTILARQFLAVIAHLAEIQPSAPSRVDEIAEKYAGRLTAIRGADSAGKARSGRKAQSG
jgi:hypothetical protein